MRVDDSEVRAAFKEHLEHYAKGRAWGIDYHVEMWNLARDAFRRNSFVDFQTLYENLRRRWQVFRDLAVTRRSSPVLSSAVTRWTRS